MKNIAILAQAAIAVLALACAGLPAYAADPVQGVNYFLIDPPHPYLAPNGKVEVTEVFSYGCPACNRFYPYMDQFRQKLPRDVVLDYVPASFSPAEDWPMFQRAYFAAQILGVAQRAHDAMFDAVWKTGQLAVVDEQSGRIKSPAPTIQDAAHFYALTTGVNQQRFLQAAMSFGVDVKIRQAEQTMRAWQIDQTPTMIVDGKYRITLQSAGGDQQLIDVTRWVIARESAQTAAQTGASPTQPQSAAAPARQQAVVQTGTGGPQVLKLQTIPVLEPGSGQVLIKVYAAAVNPADWGGLVRPAPAGTTVRRVPGLDVSGVIAAVGPGVTGRSAGMPVFAIIGPIEGGLNGAYAHYVIANAASTAPKPANVSYAQAAGLGVVGVTALGVLDEAQVQAGQRVLITGVAGGVGSTAAQIARARGATVLGTASPRHDAYLHGIGVSKTIDYAKGDVAGQAGRVDAVIDTVGRAEALDAFHAVKPGGHFVSVARAPVTPQQCAAAQVQCSGSPGHAANAPLALLLQVGKLAGEGKLRIHVDRTYPLAQTAEAVRYVHEGHTEGKVVLTVERGARPRYSSAP